MPSMLWLPGEIPVHGLFRLNSNSLYIPSAAWILYKDSGNISFDYGISKNNGILTNGPIWYPDGVSFDGTNDYIALPSSIITDFTKPVTVIVNAMTIDNTYQQNSSSPTFLDLYLNSSNCLRFGIHESTGGKIFGRYVRSGSGIVSETASGYFVNNVFVSAGFVFNGSSLKIYANGVNASLGGAATYSNGSTNSIGRKDNATGSWKGKIKEVFIFPFAANDSDMQYLYRNPYCMFLEKLSVSYFYNVGGGSTYNLEISDSAKIGESLINNLIISPSITDGLNINEENAGPGIFPLSLTDGGKIGDTIINKLLLYQLLSDNVKIGDSPSCQMIFNNTIFDGLTIGETLATALIFAIIASDEIKISDQPTTGNTFLDIITDGFKFSESLANLLISNPQLSDGIKAEDASTSQGIFISITSDGFKLNESLTNNIISILHAIDGIKISDNASPGGEIYNQSISDGVVLSDNLTAALSLILSLSDAIKISDSLTNTITFNITVSDSTKIRETISTICQFASVVTDGFKLGDLSISGADAAAVLSFTAKGKTYNFTIKSRTYNFDAKSH